MGYYHEIYNDLPSRVNRVWKRMIELEGESHQKLEEKKTGRDNEDLSVTSMLMAISVGIAMPLDYIRHKKDKEDYLSLYPAKSIDIEKNIKKINGFLGENFDDHCLFGGAKLIGCAEIGDIRRIAENLGNADSGIIDSKNVQYSLTVMRHAIAHGCIAQFGRSQSKIEGVLFFCHNKGEDIKIDRENCRFIVLSIHITSLKKVMKHWFSLL